MHLLHRVLVDQAEQREFCAVSKTRQLLQCLQSSGIQAGQLRDDEVHHIIGIPFGADAVQIPRPACFGPIKREQAFRRQGGDELGRKEWIAARLVMDQFRERNGVRWLTTQSICNQLREILAGKRRKHDVLDYRPPLADGLDLARKGMHGAYFVVPICTDQQKMPHVRLREQILDYVQSCGVEPLQIVEKQDQGMFRLCEYMDESAEYHLETSLSLLARKVENRRLISDNGLQIRDQRHHQLCVRIQRLTKGTAPVAQLLFALAQKQADQALKGLFEG